MWRASEVRDVEKLSLLVIKHCSLCQLFVNPDQSYKFPFIQGAVVLSNWFHTNIVTYLDQKDNVAVDMNTLSLRSPS